MKRIDLPNPFSGPVYYEDRVSSTMDAARSLAAQGEKPGTVIMAGFQEKGRGRLGRPWAGEKNQNLMFTLFLEYPDFSSLPQALTLRTGLAVALAVETFIPEFSSSVLVKWPNDLLLRGNEKERPKKITGILTESDGRRVFIGVGVNLSQRDFSPELTAKAASLVSAWEARFPDKEIPLPLGLPNAPERLLEKVLASLYVELNDKPPLWKNRLEARLYKRGETAAFAPGGPDTQALVRGVLAGIGDAGEILIIPWGETTPQAFVTGELRLEGY